MSGAKASVLWREDGSIFVEALMASAILSIILIAAYRTGADSVARHRMVEARRYALMIARSQLAAVGSAIPFAPGATQGVDGDDIWQVEMQPCGRGSGATLYCIAVSVRGSGAGAPLVTLDTRRLAPAA